VQCSSTDRTTFFNARNACNYTLYRHSWGADYNHPQDWFDFLFVTNGGSSGSCYSNTQLDQLENQANQKPLTQSLATYTQENKILTDNAIAPALFYGIQQYVVHPYVIGVSGNANYDDYWVDAKILQHS
jgi:oligopeptide transport system substrate-binding protein